MAKFTIRVELHDANSEDYEVLHESMKEEGFTKTIFSTDGQEYELPTAEYNFIGNISPEDVRSKARIAADFTNREYMVLVTPSNSRYWYNLKKVE